MDLRMLFLFLLLIHGALGLTCLQCKGISQPRHCKLVDECYPGEVCGVEKITNSFGDTVYNVGCITQSLCHNTSFTHQGSNIEMCRECCQSDLCNAQGCGESGYPQNRGPICFSCPIQTNIGACHEIAFCEPGEVCKSDVRHEFGDTVYTSDCSRTHECKHNYQQGTAIVGRDVTSVQEQRDSVPFQRSLTEHVCTGCCDNDLCNKVCNGTAIPLDHCSSSPCLHGRCENIAYGFACVCDRTYTGVTCDTHMGKCYSNPCIHGQCFENQERYMCVCETGYQGQLCENKTDHCQANPCVHGRCVSNIKNYTCICDSRYSGERCETVIATDCYDIFTKNIGNKSGVYSVMLWRSKQMIDVYCDMDTSPYGWTVFQKRFNGSVDFYRNFTEYTNGFGNVRGEFWLGLRIMEEMASQYESELRLDVTAADNSHVYEVFQNFSLSKYPKFTLHLGAQTVEQISGNGYGLSYCDGYDFSTFDHDVDTSSQNCGRDYHGGWWYWDCAQTNLNGEYLSPPGSTSTYYQGWGGFIYYAWRRHATLKSSQIMFRKHV